MNQSFKISCSVWHPNVPVETIISSLAIEVKPNICWSVGDINPLTNLQRERTYCTFVLGFYSQEEISEGLKMIRPFYSLHESQWGDGLGEITIYIKNVGHAPELYINLPALETLRTLSATLVFR